MQEYIGIALRIGFTYVFLLAMLRLSGKRSVFHLTPLDFLIGTAAGDLLDDIIWAEIPIAQGLVGLTTLILLHTALAFASWRSDRIDRMVAPEPTTLIRNGKIQRDGLRRERLTPRTLASMLRLGGEEDSDEVEIGGLEASGGFAILKRSPYRPLKRSEVPELQRSNP